MIRFSKCDERHQVRHSADDNKNAEADEHRVEGEGTTLRNKINKRKRDDEVSGRDQKIRDQMQPHQAGIPQVAVAMRHETVLAKENPEKVHTSQTNFAGSGNSFIDPTVSPGRANPWRRLCHVAI